MQVATAIEQGFREIYPDAEYVKLPMADGGEGTVESMVEATQGHYRYLDVTGPLGTEVQARWGVLGDGKTAIIEMAAASGLHHVPPESRNPLLTTSFGTGELILAALDHGVEHIILGIGGSATNDGVPACYRRWASPCSMSMANLCPSAAAPSPGWQKSIPHMAIRA